MSATLFHYPTLVLEKNKNLHSIHLIILGSTLSLSEMYQVPNKPGRGKFFPSCPQFPPTATPPPLLSSLLALSPPFSPEIPPLLPFSLSSPSLPTSTPFHSKFFPFSFPPLLLSAKSL